MSRRRPDDAPSDVLVLGYHAISDRWDADTTVTVAQFERQIATLLERGYVGVTFATALSTPHTVKYSGLLWAAKWCLDASYRLKYAAWAAHTMRHGIDRRQQPTWNAPRKHGGHAPPQPEHALFPNQAHRRLHVRHAATLLTLHMRLDGIYRK